MGRGIPGPVSLGKAAYSSPRAAGCGYADSMSRKTPDQPYAAPLDHLLTLGCPGGHEDSWDEAPFDDYAAMGIGPEHADELRRLAFDIRLHEPDDVALCFGPVHAARALTALASSDALPDLIELTRRLDRADYDYWLEDMPVLFAHIGEAAIDPLARVTRDIRETFGTQLFLMAGLKQIATDCPETRDRVVAVFVDMLRYAEYGDPGINGAIIATLLELDAIEAMPAIRKAFATGRVDYMCCGSLESIEETITLSPEERKARTDAEIAEIEKEMEGMSEDEIMEVVTKRVQETMGKMR